MPVDPAACFAVHRERVYRWAVALCRRREDAADVTQEAFLRLVRAAGGIADGAAAAAWLRTTVSRLAIDRVRREAARTVREETFGAGPSAELHEGVSAADAETFERLRAALAELSEQQRLVLMCKHYDGLTFAEIARALDIAVPTAKTHYVRGLAALRARLGAANQTESVR